jgi:hypothetical protein
VNQGSASSFLEVHWRRDPKKPSAEAAEAATLSIRKPKGPELSVSAESEKVPEKNLHFD